MLFRFYKKYYIRLLFFILLFFCFVHISSAQYGDGGFMPTCVPGQSITLREDAQGRIVDVYTENMQNNAAGYSQENIDRIIQASPGEQQKIKEALSVCGDVKTVPALELEAKPSAELTFTPEVGFPGFTKTIKVDGSFFGNFIAALLRYTIYISGIFAVIMIMFAGFQWVSAGGNQTQIGISKKRLIDALMGFFLCISCVLILGTINPDLINIKNLKLTYIDEVVEDTSAIGVVYGGKQAGALNPDGKCPGYYGVGTCPLMPIFYNDCTPDHIISVANKFYGCYNGALNCACFATSVLHSAGCIPANLVTTSSNDTKNKFEKYMKNWHVIPFKGNSPRKGDLIVKPFVHVAISNGFPNTIESYSGRGKYNYMREGGYENQFWHLPASEFGTSPNLNVQIIGNGRYAPQSGFIIRHPDNW